MITVAAKQAHAADGDLVSKECKLCLFAHEFVAKFNVLGDPVRSPLQVMGGSVSQHRP